MMSCSFINNVIHMTTNEHHYLTESSLPFHIYYHRLLLKEWCENDPPVWCSILQMKNRNWFLILQHVNPWFILCQRESIFKGKGSIPLGSISSIAPGRGKVNPWCISKGKCKVSYFWHHLQPKTDIVPVFYKISYYFLVLGSNFL